MDPNFTFPRAQAPIPRPRPLHNQSAPAPNPNLDAHNRQSNALRASVLDVALQLGIGNNNLVAAWMFDNPVQEEDEEDQVSPSLTYGSSATSDESFRGYPATPSTSTQSSIQPTYRLPIARGVDTLDSLNSAPSKPLGPETSGFATPTPDLTLKLPGDNNAVTFPSTIPVPSRPSTPGGRKLKKKRGDGYESDGGYMSESGKKKEKKDKKKKEKEKEEAERREKGVDGEPEPGRKKKKSFVTLRSSKKSEEKEADQAAGYETDGALAFKKGGKSKTKKTSKTGSEDAGYGSDGGYLSSAPVKKSKSRFFKIGSKSSKPDLRQDVDRADSISSGDKDKEFLPLPIAERFATTLAQPLPTIPQSPPPSSPSSSLPYRSPIPQDLVIPPVSIDSITGPPSTSIPSPREHVSARDSHISAVSATSTSTSTSSSGSHNKRKFFHFPGIRENGHGQGAGSNSTFASSLQVRSPSPTSSSPTSPSPSAKYPPISFPVTRATSPVPGHSASPLPTSSSSQDLKRSDSSTLSPYAFPPRSHTPSRAPSPSPSSVGLTPNSSSQYGSAASGLPTSPRPRNPPTDGFGPRPKLSPGGSPAVTPPSPHKPSQLHIQPSSDSLGPSPRNSILQSPNVLSYYDLPPPSPPPALPLPRVPQDGNATGAVPRPQVPSRLASESSLATTAPLNIMRGRVSPFPVSPRTSRATSPVGLGIGARTMPSRYEQYNYANQNISVDEDDRSPRTPGIDVVEPSEDGGSFWEEEYEDDMNDVLQRFEDTSSEGHEGGRALESRRSFEAIKKTHASMGEVSQFDDDDDVRTVMRSSIESTSDDRNHRWSGSIYSRASFLDPDKSEETRKRFLKRVESMLNEDERGGGSAIPPVPKLPAGYAAAKVAPPQRSWNRF